MTRLPTPGSDDGTWGTILNDFLAQVHNADGSLKNNVVGLSALNVGTATSGQVLTYDGTGLSWSTPSSSGSVPDATSTVKGLVQLTGDLGGTAASPTVPGLTSKVDTTTTVNGHALSTNVTVSKADVGLGSVDNTSDASKPVSTATQTALNAKADDSAVVHSTGNETVAGIKTFSSSPIVPTPTTSTQAANKSYVDSAAGAAPADATTTSKGIVQLAGDLAGTAAAPSVAKVNGIAVSGTPSTGQVLTATSASAASWQAATGGGSGYTFTFRSITASATAADADFIFADSTSGAITITLPTASANAFVRVKRMNTAGNGVQVVAASGYIDGSGVGSVTVNNQYESQDFLSDGTNWYRV